MATAPSVAAASEALENANNQLFEVQQVQSTVHCSWAALTSSCTVQRMLGVSRAERKVLAKEANELDDKVKTLTQSLDEARKLAATAEPKEEPASKPSAANSEALEEAASQLQAGISGAQVRGEMKDRLLVGAEPVSYTFESEGKLGLKLISRPSGQLPIGVTFKECTIPEVATQLSNAGINAGMMLTQLGTRLVVGVSYPDVIQQLKTAGRPLTLKFNEV
jgi:hypothetical protein